LPLANADDTVEAWGLPAQTAPHQKLKEAKKR
jgi:hypothetical protein